MSQYNSGFSYSKIDYTLDGSIQRPCREIMKLRNLTVLMQKAHLLILAQSFYCLNLLSTIAMCSSCSNSSSKKIRMSLRYTTQIVSKRPLRALFMYAQKLARALAKLNSITQYSKCLYLMQKAIFYSSPSLMRSLQQASQRSNFVQMFAYNKRSIILLISRSRYQFLIVILLSPQQSMHIRMLLSDLGTNRIGAPARDLLSQIYLFFKALSRYSQSITSLLAERLQIRRYSRIPLGLRSIAWSCSKLDASVPARSFSKTSIKGLYAKGSSSSQIKAIRVQKTCLGRSVRSAQLLYIVLNLLYLGVASTIAQQQPFFYSARQRGEIQVVPSSKRVSKMQSILCSSPIQVRVRVATTYAMYACSPSLTQFRSCSICEQALMEPLLVPRSSLQANCRLCGAN